ncbi:hypothetical protein ACHAW6_003843 [Cyclotella cf. meneghiniana]
MVDSKGMVYLKVTKGMYGLPQAGLLAYKLLEKRLNKHGYFQSKIIPGLWNKPPAQSHSLSLSMILESNTSERSMLRISCQ